MPNFSSKNVYILTIAMVLVFISVFLSLLIDSTPENINKILNQAKEGDISGDVAVAFASGLSLLTGTLLGVIGVGMVGKTMYDDYKK